MSDRDYHTAAFIGQLIQRKLRRNLGEVLKAIAETKEATGRTEYDPTTLSFQTVWGMPGEGVE